MFCLQQLAQEQTKTICFVTFRIGTNENSYFCSVWHRIKRKHIFLYCLAQEQTKTYIFVSFCLETHENHFVRRLEQESTKTFFLVSFAQESTNCLFYIGFHIQPIGINEKAMVLLGFAQESTNKHRFYNRFLIHPIGTNKKKHWFYVVLLTHKRKSIEFYNGCRI